MQATYETDLKCRRVDENGEPMFGMGESGFIHKAEAMAQALEYRLKSIAGEWWEGDDDGWIPWMTEVVGQRMDDESAERIDLMVIELINGTVGVDSVEGIESYIDERRQYHFSCTVNTVYGQVEVSV